MRNLKLVLSISLIFFSKAYASADEINPEKDLSTVHSCIYIYGDIGAGEEGLANLQMAFSTVVPKVEIKTLTAEDVLKGDWCLNAIVFVMPGGADLPYVEKLNGTGNSVIRTYVEGGGRYLGICAGAYYGSSFCDFHRGDERGYEVLGPRELSFFKGSAVGPVLAPYVYKSEEGARLASLKGYDGHSYTSYYNGGCYFSLNGDDTVRVLATYEDEIALNKPAIIECQVGSGKAILSGVHPEHPLDDKWDSSLFRMIVSRVLTAEL